MREPVEEERPAALSPDDRLALSACGAAILLLGIFPAALWNLSYRAAEALFLGR
jgi:hypothetical protein